MRTSLFIACICSLLSCGLLKTTTGSTIKTDTESKESLELQQISKATKSTSQRQTFWSKDSSETISMVEISPSGIVRFAKDSGFSVEAHSIRIFTKHKTGREIAGKMQKKENISAKTTKSITSAKENKTAVVQKVKQRTPSVLLIVALIGGALILCLVKFRSTA